MIRRSMESARGTVLSPSVILFRLRPCLAQFPESAESWEYWGWWATENGFRMKKKWVPLDKIQFGVVIKAEKKHAERF